MMLGSMVSLASAGSAGAVEDESAEAAPAVAAVSCFAPTPHSFGDMGSHAWADTAVSWLVESEITAGIGNGNYGPQSNVTRAQMAVFLHKAAGGADPVGSHPFTDMGSHAWAETSVRWLYESGITAGVSADHFGPQNTVTRAQMAVFLHKAAGNQPPAGTHSFTDVPADSFAGTSISWLVESGITAGIAPGLFGPQNNVTRAQMAVFLHTKECGAKPIAVDGGERHNCALKADGTIACWGHNSDGQMGIGTSNKQQWIPVTVRGIGGATDIATGSFHTCAVKADTTVACWGNNRNGQLGDNTTTNRSLPVAVSGLSGVRNITAGSYHTCATKNDGTVACWGENNNGQLGDGSTTERRTPVAVGAGLSGVTAVSGGSVHNCAQKSNGTVACWGRNDRGQLGDGSNTTRTTPLTVANLSGVTAVDSGWLHTCAAKSDGTVDCWGYNGDGQLGLGNTTDRNTPATIPALAGVTTIGVGAYHGCAVKAGGTVACWGYNKDGQAGDGTTSVNRKSPVDVVGLTGAKSVAGGSYTNCAVKASGATLCWGLNWHGRLGDGTGTTRTTPVQVAYPNPIVR
ncbi:S-layer homology domain-containing protein [Candidatus Microthrix parvicella]|uniref:SLH domain-containing protein n=1 Tax=Candidatus Neomicrothrix parvicella RN1 TaxID=1229780 RepID=R4Z7L6_9ACTN|nr:S-layer homology domain-containing protein [Candidatus Microthrix parvicella]CCM65722.1 exported hypothetical protein [Candidatus Microthrix parvicella RN1]